MFSRPQEQYYHHDPSGYAATPNSRLVPPPSSQLQPSSSTEFHAISGESYQTSSQRQQQAYNPQRESDLYSTYNTRESLIDPVGSDERSAYVSRETYIEPNTSTLVHTHITPQSIYGGAYDESQITLASKKSSAHINNFFQSESSESLGEIRRLQPPLMEPVRSVNVESPIRMHHAYVQVPQPSTAVIEQTHPASIIEHHDGEQWAMITPRASTSTSSRTRQSDANKQRQHPQPLTPLVIPPTSDKTTSPRTPSHTHHYHNNQSNNYNAYSSHTASSLTPQQYQMNPPQLTPGSAVSPMTQSASPRTPSPATSPRTATSPRMMTSPKAGSPLSATTSARTAPATSKKEEKPMSEVEQLVSHGIKHHEAGRLDKATEYFRQAAQKDFPIAMFLYGVSLRHGWGCKRNEHMAFQYLQKAAEHAVMDLNSLSSTVNTSAVKGELIMAIYELGVSFRHGWGCRKNKETAVYFFRIAADLGDADAQNDLGHCYYHGHGVKKDLYQAAKYYRMADKQGAGIMGNSWIYKPKYDAEAKKK